MEKEEICLRLMELMRVETINHNLFLAKKGDYEEKSGKIKREYFFEKYKEYKNGTFNSLEKTRNDFKKEYFDRTEEVRKKYSEDCINFQRNHEMLIWKIKDLLHTARFKCPDENVIKDVENFLKTCELLRKVAEEISLDQIDSEMKMEKLRELL